MDGKKNDDVPVPYSYLSSRIVYLVTRTPIWIIPHYSRRGRVAVIIIFYRQFSSHVPRGGCFFRCYFFHKYYQVPVCSTIRGTIVNGTYGIHKNLYI